MLHLLDVVDDPVVVEVFEVRQSVEDPESGIVAVGQHVTVTHTKFDGYLGDGAVEGRIDGGVGVVHAEPDDATDGVGEPRTALGDERETGLYHLDAALIEIFLAVIFPIKGIEAERRAERIRPGIQGLVQLSALEMVTLEGHHVAEADLAVGLDIQWHAVGEVLAGDIVPVFVHAVTYLVEHGPHAEVADTRGAKIHGSVGGTEVEVLVLAAKVALPTGEVDDVVLVDDLDLGIIKLLPVFVGDGSLAVTQGKGGDACGIGVTAHIAVGDADGDPHGTTVGVDGVAGLGH